MTRARDSKQRTTAAGEAAKVIGDSRRDLLPYAWPLFTAIWLLFPIGFVVQGLRSALPPVELLAFLASVASFLALFLWIMLRYPFPAAELMPRELGVRVGLLLALAVLALYVELAYGSGVPYHFMYVVITAAAILPMREASWMVAAVTICTGAVYASRSGWDAAATGWQDLVPFPLVGLGMIIVSRLGHSLSLITLKSTLAGRLLPVTPETERAAKEVRDVEGVAREALREVREAVAGYQRPTLDAELAGAREMLEAVGIDCRIENTAGELPNATEAVLAWAVREGVTNTMRHSRAERCEIRLAKDGEVVRAEVNDGRGPSSEGPDTGTGLSGLAERKDAGYSRSRSQHPFAEICA